MGTLTDGVIPAFFPDNPVTRKPVALPNYFPAQKSGLTLRIGFELGDRREVTGMTATGGCGKDSVEGGMETRRETRGFQRKEDAG